MIRKGLDDDVRKTIKKSTKKVPPTEAFELMMKAMETIHIEHFQAVHPDKLLPSDETEVNSSTTLQVTVC